MTNSSTALETHKPRRRSCLAFHELALIAFGIASSVQKTDGFHARHKKLSSRCRQSPSSSPSPLCSQRTDAGIGWKLPFFTDPKKSPKDDVQNHRVSDGKKNIDDLKAETSVFSGLLKLASMHGTASALNAAVRLKIPDLLGQQRSMSVEQLASAIEEAIPLEDDDEEDLPCNQDALFRTLRLLASIDVVREEVAPSSASEAMSAQSSFRFSLTPLGQALRTNKNDSDEPNPSSAILHWMEEPLWNSWLEVPDYIRDGGYEDKSLTLLPFERANGAVPSDEYYNQDDHPVSLKRANDFVRLIHDQELRAVVRGFDWSQYDHMRLVDVAGNNGKLAEAIAGANPTLECSCMDLPSVIHNIPPAHKPTNVALVPGNVMDPETIPDCEVLLMKHFCDRSMWFDDQTVEILRSCATVLQRSHRSSSNSSSSSNTTVRRKLIVADAVLPDCGAIDESNVLPLYMDAMYMLVGRERQRTRSEWKALAEAAGLQLAEVIDTGVPSCSLIVLEPKAVLSP